MLIKRHFKVFGATIIGNKAKYGGFASFQSPPGTHSEITFDLRDSEIKENEAEIAGGAYYLFEPVKMFIPCDIEGHGNSAGKYGNYTAGQTEKLATHYWSEIYPFQVFTIDVRRLDRCGQQVTREVLDYLEYSSVTLRVEGGMSVHHYITKRN